MEKYPDLARGFTKRDKPTVDSLWQKLAESLNGAGPPQKDINGWKKVRKCMPNSFAVVLNCVVLFHTDVDGMEKRCKEKACTKQSRVQSNWWRTILKASADKQ